MDEYALLVFRNQHFTDEEHLAFAQRLDGQLHTKTGISALQKSRLGNEALADVSNLNANGEVYQADDRKRMYGLGNRLWHTDASFQDPPGRYSMLFARVVPPVSADTEYADMRAAYDRLSDEMKERLEGLRVHHSIAHFAPRPGFRVFPNGTGDSQGRDSPSDPYPATYGTQVALHRGARLQNHRLADPRRAPAAARTD